MNRCPDQKRDDGRKPYKQPQLTRVELRPEEAVLGHCKAAGNGPASPGCASPVPCNTPGS
jgi:hypothetical protein